jgi:4-amino-4-deoxy-L-arabinose transferase-like glycosyltransferase
MAHFNWWRQYRQPTPNPMPARFADVPDRTSPIGGGVQPVYYVASATYLKLLPLDGLLAQYAAVRILSMICAASTILAAWAAARLLFGELSAAVVAMVMALHPQFLLVALTAGPDAFVNLLGAVIWWQAARMIRDRQPLAAIAVMLLCACLLVFTKRQGAPVAAAAPLLAFGYAMRQVWVQRRRAAWVAAIVGLAAGALAAVIWLFPAQYETLRYSWSLFLRSPAEWHPRASTWNYFVVYTKEMFNSAWLVAGYLRYPAPPLWFAVTYLLMAVGVAGVVRAIVRTRRDAAGVVAAAGLVVVQLVALYATTYTLFYGAQGRYLFPVAAAMAALLWVGFREFWPPAAHRHAAATLIAIMLAMDVAGWFNVLIPAYVY